MSDTTADPAEDTGADSPSGAGFRELPRPVRLLAWAAAGMVLLLLVALIAGVTLVRSPFPETSGELRLAALDGEVEVIRDEHGIPQLYGDSIADLLRAQGYVHAQERFFEMDVRRHATSGRLAELFGADAVASDTAVRTMGWRRVAQQELALIRPDTRAALEAYAQGVNAYLDDRSPREIAVEYTVLDLGGLDYRPEPWGPVDSLAWLKAMAWDLRGNMTEEIDRVMTASMVGTRRMTELYPPYPFGRHDPIVDQGAVIDGVFEPQATGAGSRNPLRPAYTADQVDALRGTGDALARIPAMLGTGEGIGSNSWVVSGERSTTGKPLLANDPHLGLSLPGVWTQMGLHCRSVSPDCPLDVAGFTFSGVPGVIIGHNADIAWGFTNLGPDVTDLYVERVSGDEWLHDGRWRPLRTRTETIRVAGGEDVAIEVRSTRHGPLVSDADDRVERAGRQSEAGLQIDSESESSTDPVARADEEAAVALSWTALDPAPTADAILDLNLAGDWDSFRAAAASFTVPAQNLVYADRAGHIGYQAPGRIPIRKSGNDGTMPSAGWLPENDWTGEFIAFDGLPQVLDPDDGYLVTANQAVIGPSYPYRLTDDWDRGYRSQRIGDRIRAEERLSPETMAQLQVDDRHPFAPVLVPHLLDIDLPDGYWSDGQRVLADWDFTQSADSAGAAYYNVLWRNLLELTFHDELPEEVWPDGGERWFAVVERLLKEPDSLWWDDVSTSDVIESRDDILEQALRAARDEITALMAQDPRRWEWGRLHRLDLRSPTLGESGIGPVERLVNRTGWQAAGGASTVNATGWDAARGYQVDWAPSMRMVVSLADLDESRWINLTGVSGHPFHRHYTDQTELWVRGETLVWPFSREAVEAAAEDTLVLRPVED